MLTSARTREWQGLIGRPIVERHHPVRTRPAGHGRVPVRDVMTIPQGLLAEMLWPSALRARLTGMWGAPR
eukprot:990931-Prymnesium_polylepis.3